MSSTRWFWPGLAASLLLAWLAYLPGLSGGFLFDDYVNLDVLGFEAPLDSVDAFLRYLTSGQADPTGRPVALLTFLIDAQHWPASPGPFLRTNLLIHLGNGLLLALLLRRLGRALGDEEARCDQAAVLGAALWLLHPLLVSTTLYAVQRQAMLAASFVLAGLLAWMKGRDVLARGDTRAATAWMVGGIAIGTVLAGFSKANGFLLPLLALAIEWVLGVEAFAPAAQRRLRRCRALLLLLPSLLLLLALAAQGLDARNYAGREFTLGTRLWSEARALVDYLRLLALPGPSDGVFNDDFRASVSWRSPASSLPCALAVLALVAAGAMLRRRAPAWSIGLLFFFAGHLLESSVLPLELRYEHRNYLPALLLFWPLARSLYGWRAAARWRHVIAFGLVVAVALPTWQRARLWGNPPQLAANWLVRHPDSPRAVAAASIALRAAGRPEDAVRLLAHAWERAPGESQIALNFIESRCAAGQLQPADLRLLGRSLALSAGDLVVLRWLDDAVGPSPGFACTLGPAEVEGLVDVVARNPAFANARARQNLENTRARIALRRHDPAQAVSHFRASLLAQVRPEVAAAQAALLIDAGYHREAMQHLDYYESIADRAARPPFGMPRVHEWLLRRQGYWPEVFARLRATAQAASP